MAVVGGYFKDRLWVIQSFWSIFYRKILWYHLNFAIVTLVIYGHRLLAAGEQTDIVTFSLNQPCG